MTEQNLPPISAQGLLGKTPFPHLLVYVLDRQLTGTMELTAPDGERASILLIGGGPSKVRLGEPLAYLGHVLVEEGMIDEDQLTQSTQVWLEKKAAREASGDTTSPPILHGHVLRELGILDEEGVREGLRRQLVHKVEHLLNWPAETKFEYYDQYDALAGFGVTAEVSVDPLPLVWAGVRQYPSWDHANAALTKLGNSAIRVADRAVIERLDFGPQELALATELRSRPMRLTDLMATKIATPSITQLFVYCLLITKQVDLLSEEVLAGMGYEAAPVSRRMDNQRPSSPSAAPSAPSVPPASSSAPFSVTMNSESKPANGAQVARVQLAKGRAPSLPSAMVEERAPIVRIDGRIATPMPGTVMPNTADIAAAKQANAANSPPPQSTPTLGSAVSQSMPAVNPGSRPQVSLGTATPAPPPASSSNMASALGGASGGASSSSIPAALPAGAGGAIPPPPSSSRAPAPLSMRGAVLAAAFNKGEGSPASRRPTELSPEHQAQRQKIIERAAQIQKQNYFEMLGLTKDAVEGEVRQAYLEAAKQWHPDRLPAALIEMKPEVSRIFSHLGEAHATLTDPSRLGKYMNLLKDGGATPEDQETIARVVEATTDFQKAEHFMKRNDFAQAEEFAKRAHKADPDQADYAAMVAWLDAQKPVNQNEDDTLASIDLLNQALKKNARCERAIFYRAQLYKRLGRDKEALADFRQAVDLNPRNIEAAREIRLHNMRRESRAPGPAGRSSAPPPNASSKAGEIFGKLFKK